MTPTSVPPGTDAGTGSELRVALVQEASGLEPADNRARLERVTPSGADLVVLPEAFARDFGEAGSDVGAYAESPDGPFGQELARVAALRETTLVAGMFETSGDPDRPWNTLLVRGAATASYRKIHLYDSFGYRESDRLAAGAVEPVLVDVAGFSVGLMTCYDLRFPELARALVVRGAELLVVPSAWVAGPRKVDHWRTLVRARAIENTVFVAAAGQPGPRYTGHSVVADAGRAFAITAPGTDRATGAVALLGLDWKNRHAALAWIEAGSDTGAAAEAALSLLASFAFDELGLERLEAETLEPEGTVVMSALGFQREALKRDAALAGARRRDLTLWGLLCDERPERRFPEQPVGRMRP